MNARIDLLLSEYFVQDFVGSAKLYIVIKNEAGNNNDADGNDQCSLAGGVTIVLLIFVFAFE